MLSLWRCASTWSRHSVVLSTTASLSSLSSSPFKPPSPLNNDQWTAVHSGLQLILDSTDISTAESVRKHHGHDESWHRGQFPPDFVVTPHSTQQVSEICRLLHANAVPIIPYGTGTGLEGGVVALHGGVCVDLVHFNKPPDVRAADFNARVGAGLTRLSLNDHLRGTGLFFAVDPGADASICGMAATNASGTNAVKYGTMRENVLNLEVVLADGTIVHTAGPNRHAKKSSAGYNLTSLFVGSEGTLGVITEATVRLQPHPSSVAAAVCAFPDVASAVETTVNILQTGVPIARIEFLDEVQIAASNVYSHLSLPEAPTLFFEFHGGDDEEVAKQAETVEALALANAGLGFDWARETEARNRLWKARHSAWYAARALRPGCEGISTDVCVPISRLPAVLTTTKEDLKQCGLQAPIVGHVGDGNFHCLVIFDKNDEAEAAEVALFCGRLVERALSVGGTCTGEHAVGIGKRKWVPLEFGDGAYHVMRQIKSTLDPLNIMNPGKKILMGT